MQKVNYEYFDAKITFQDSKAKFTNKNILIPDSIINQSFKSDVNNTNKVINSPEKWSNTSRQEYQRSRSENFLNIKN